MPKKFLKMSKDSKAVAHVKGNQCGIGRHWLFRFDFHLLGRDNPVEFECVANGSSEAWILAALRASNINPPVMRVDYKGQE